MNARTEYFRARKARLAAAGPGGLCDCGQPAAKFFGGDRVCARCAAIESANHGSELARGVVGFVAYGILARRVHE